MIMVVRTLNNSLALTGLWVCLVLLIGIRSTEAVDHCQREYYAGIGCISFPARYGSRCPERWFCDHLKNWFDDDVTCFVNGKTYREGEKFVVPAEDKELYIECTCASGYPDKPNCTYALAYFITAVLNRVEDIKSRTGGS